MWVAGLGGFARACGTWPWSVMLRVVTARLVRLGLVSLPGMQKRVPMPAGGHTRRTVPGRDGEGSLEPPMRRSSRDWLPNLLMIGTSWELWQELGFGPSPGSLGREASPQLVTDLARWPIQPL